MLSEVNEVAEFLQLEITDPQAVLAVEWAIKEATAVIKEYTNQTLEKVDDEEIQLSGNGRNVVILPEVPVINISGVEVSDDLLEPAIDYTWVSQGLLYRLGGFAWPRGINNITVTYTHGYPTIPVTIQGVCIRSAARVFQASLRSKAFGGLSGVSSLSLGDYSVNLGSEQGGGMGEGILGVSAARVLLREEKAILDRYRHKGI